MRTLSNVRVRNELLERLAKVCPRSKSRWGTMSSHQMICHLSDSFRASLGERNISPSTRLFKRMLLKWTSINVVLHPRNSLRT
jgi:hypothetical protein